jgi:hypothetical protein
MWNLKFESWKLSNVYLKWVLNWMGIGNWHIVKTWWKIQQHRHFISHGPTCTVQRNVKKLYYNYIIRAEWQFNCHCFGFDYLATVVTQFIFRINKFGPSESPESQLLTCHLRVIGESSVSHLWVISNKSVINRWSLEAHQSSVHQESQNT